MTAITDTFKVIETIDDRVGSYYFSPTLILSGPRRKQCPLYSVNSESSLLDCAGNDRRMRDWSRGAMPPPHHKPIDSSRVGTGQSSRRGRVRCQSLFIAGERRRCEPGSNSVIVTAPFTGCEGHVAGLGDLQRTRKIFVGCPAIRPIRDQSPGRTASRFETVGNRLYPLHDQDCLRRFNGGGANPRSFHAQRPDQIPPRAFYASPVVPAEAGTQKKQSTPSSPLPRWERARVRVTPRTPPSFPRRREPSENKARRPAPPARSPEGGSPNNRTQSQISPQSHKSQFRQMLP